MYFLINLPTGVAREPDKRGPDKRAETVYLSMDLTIVLPTDMQNRHEYNAYPLPNSTAQCELMDMSQYHEKSIMIHQQIPLALWFGVEQGHVWAACAEVSTGSMEASKANHGPVLHMGPVYTEEY
jgi:hypothetical protein